MRKLIALLSVLIILIIIAAIGAFFYIDTLAKQAVERGGTYAFGVNTTVDSVNVGLMSGEVELSDLEIDNPEGYDAQFLELDNGRMQVTLASLRDEVVVVPLLHLDGVDMHLQRAGGKTNYDIILENLKRLTDPDEPGKRYIINEVAITDITAHVNVVPIGGDLTKLDLIIDEIRLENVGTEGDRGVVLSELARVVMHALLAAVVEKGKGVIPTEMLGDLAGRLAELPDLSELGINFDLDAISEQLEGLKDQLPGDLDDLGREADEALRGIEDDAAGAIGDILGGNRDRNEEEAEEADDADNQ